jgi:hypothetical protein
MWNFFLALSRANKHNNILFVWNIQFISKICVCKKKINYNLTIRNNLIQDLTQEEVEFVNQVWSLFIFSIKFRATPFQRWTQFHNFYYENFEALITTTLVILLVNPLWPNLILSLNI